MALRGRLGPPRGPQKGPKIDGILDPGWPLFRFYLPRALKTDFEPIWGPSWAQLGAILGPSWGVLGPFWGLLGPSWAYLGQIGVLLGPSWA